MRGKIKLLKAESGYGFLQTDEGDKFFHCTGLIGVKIGELRIGQRVEFEEVMGRRGLLAVDVRPI
jgi:cold shock protein